MKEFKAPENYKSAITTDRKIIFLAGSVEMGKAEPWQERIANELKSTSLVLLNPRREDWDSSWSQTKDDPRFSEQVNWELDGIRDADVVAFYFDPNTASPITLLELGSCIHRKKAVVCCPEGYFRKGNVDIVCDRYGIDQVGSLEELIEVLKSYDSDVKIKNEQPDITLVRSLCKEKFVLTGSMMEVILEYQKHRNIGTAEAYSQCAKWREAYGWDSHRK